MRDVIKELMSHIIKNDTFVVREVYIVLLRKEDYTKVVEQQFCSLGRLLADMGIEVQVDFYGE
jgi:hypothetical protein